MAQFLRNHGYEASALRGGLAAWRAAGYPMKHKQVTAGPRADEPCPDCDEDAAAHMA